MQLCTHLSTIEPQPFTGRVSLGWPGLQPHLQAGLGRGFEDGQGEEQGCWGRDQQREDAQAEQGGGGGGYAPEGLEDRKDRGTISPRR